MPSVLVVDYQDQVRQLIRETLEQAGDEVEEAYNGKEWDCAVSNEIDRSCDRHDRRM